MSIGKGYPTQEKEDRLKAEFVTVEPIRTLQHGMSVVAHNYVYQVGTDTSEALSSAIEIVATAHAAQKGDVIRLTSGPLSGKEAKVFAVSANGITLAETLPSAVGAGVTFQILRHKYPLLNSDGTLPLTITPAPVKFVLDGSTVDVTEDTVTPANNLPLPVKLTSVTGDINITAGDLNVQLSHAGGSYDSTRIGDGTELLSITASGQAEVAVTSALPAGANVIGGVTQSGTWNINNVSGTISLPTGAATSANQTNGTQKSQLVDGAGDVTDVVQLGTAVTTSDKGLVTNSVIHGESSASPGTYIDVKVTPSGAMVTESSISSIADVDGQKTMALSFPVVIASDQSAIPVSQSGTWNITNISGTVSLPTGAATETTLSTINGKMATLGQKSSAGSMPVVIASDQGNVNVNVASALPTGTNTIGFVTVNTGSVIDLLDTPLWDTSVSNIAGSASLPTEVVASLAANTKKLQIIDTTGAFIGFYTGPASSEVLRFIIGPGSDQTIEHAIGSSTRISLKRLDSTTAISSGMIAINFIS